MMQALNWVDYVILTIFFLSLIAGLARGLVRETISLITLIVAFIAASLFANPLANSFTSSSSVQDAVSQSSAAIHVSTAEPISYAAIGLSFGCIFLVTMIVGALIGFIVNLIFQGGILGIGNRLLGGIFGLCRGFIINLVLIFLVQLTSFSADDFWKKSQLIGNFQPAVIWLGNIVSPSLANLKSRMEDTLQNVDSNLGNMIAVPVKEKGAPVIDKSEE